MKTITVAIPHYKELILHHLVLDYNGTIAKDGHFKEELRPLLTELSKQITLHVITSDTFGSVQKAMKDVAIKVNVLTSDDHTQEKADYITSLTPEHCMAIGNGSNDMEMLKKSAIGIALIGDEGCSSRTLLASDIVSHNISDALALLLNTKRLIATLRQ